MYDPQPVFKALADPTRREILGLLAQSPKSVAELTTQFDMTRAAVKKHLIILEDGQLITAETQGRTRINSLAPAGFAPVKDWIATLDSQWDDALSALKTQLEKDMS